MLIAQFLVRVAVTALMYGTLTMGPVWLMTGSVAWPRGWLALAVLVATQLAIGAWLLKSDPGLLRERVSVQRPQTRSDRAATMLILVLLACWFVMAAIDGHHLRLLSALPSGVSLSGGLGLFVCGVAVVVWTFRENSFAAPVVKIQRDRKQHVVDTGPYAFVRHPLYAGLIPLFVGLGLILDSSTMALVAVPMVLIGFLPRMVTEEATLRRELEGYEDYLSRVRSRLIPGLF